MALAIVVLLVWTLLSHLNKAEGQVNLATEDVEMLDWINRSFVHPHLPGPIGETGAGGRKRNFLSVIQMKCAITGSSLPCNR